MINTMDMESTVQEQMTIKSLQLLRDGFKQQFASFAYADERMTALLMDLSTEFVDANIPIIDDDIQHELAVMMMETIDITVVR